MVPELDQDELQEKSEQLKEQKTLIKEALRGIKTSEENK